MSNLVSQPPLTTPITDGNGVLTRAWSIWFRDLYKRTSYKGGNTIDQNKEEVDQELLNTNASLTTTIDALNINTTNLDVTIGALNTDIANLDTHENETIAHGSNGDIIGALDVAEETIAGLVEQMALISDAVASTVSVDSADILAAPVGYDQSHIETIRDLANETKADLNTLVTDVNNAITTINDLLAGSINSGQMNNA